MEIAKFLYLPTDKKIAIMYLSKVDFTCPNEQIMHKQLSLALTVLIPNVNFFKNSIKPDLNSIENSVDTDQLASELFSKEQASLKYLIQF